MQVQTRMKWQTLQWRICVMRHALGSLNEQLSSLGAAFSASGWVKPGGVSAGCRVRSQGQWQLWAPSSALGQGLPFSCVWCEMLALHPCPQTWTSHSSYSLPWLTDSTGGDTDVSIYIQTFVAWGWACVGWLIQCLGQDLHKAFLLSGRALSCFV